MMNNQTKNLSKIFSLVYHNIFLIKKIFNQKNNEKKSLIVLMFKHNAYYIDDIVITDITHCDIFF